VHQCVDQIHAEAAVHAGLQVMFLNDSTREVDPIGSLTLVAYPHFELFRVEHKDDLDELRGLAMIAVFDSVIDSLAHCQLEILDTIGRKPDRLADLISAGAHDTLEDWV